jgi:hypothetical protein
VHPPTLAAPALVANGRFRAMLGGRCRITDPGPGNHRRTGPTAAVNRIRSLRGVAMSPPASTISLCPSFLDPSGVGQWRQLSRLRPALTAHVLCDSRATEQRLAVSRRDCQHCRIARRAGVRASVRQTPGTDKLGASPTPSRRLSLRPRDAEAGQRPVEALGRRPRQAPQFDPGDTSLSRRAGVWSPPGLAHLPVPARSPCGVVAGSPACAADGWPNSSLAPVSPRRA